MSIYVEDTCSIEIYVQGVKYIHTDVIHGWVYDCVSGLNYPALTTIKAICLN